MKIDDATLMAFHDGELDAEAAQRVRVAKLADRSVSARLEALEQLGEFVRVWASTGQRVVERSPTPKKRRSARPLAVAAALFGLALLVPDRAPRGEASPSASVVPGETAAAHPAAHRFEPAVAVENVDFGSRPGTVFLVESALSETTVVWLNEGPVASVTGTL